MYQAMEERANCAGVQAVNALAQDTKKIMPKSEEIQKMSGDETKSPAAELFPWLTEFKRMCRRVHMDKSMNSLTELMQFYVRNVGISANECYTRPLRAAKLKDCISETLLLFMYIYRELSEERDRSVYLDSMSDLLALYVDMELKASRKSKEGHEKICARLTSCLYVYLEHSTEYLLDTLMKIQFMCRGYHRILDPIITKVIKSIPRHPESGTMYVRYFLVYRLWRKINEDAASKSRITTNGIASLGPPPSAFPPCALEDLLPKVPKSQPNSTKLLMQQKFDIKKCCELFLQSGRNQNRPNASGKTDGELRKPEDVTCKDIERVDNVNSIVLDKSNESVSLLNTFNKPLDPEKQASFKRLSTFTSNVSTKPTISKSSKLGKCVSRRKFKKSNEVVIIDLTSDVAFEKCIKKRKPRNVAWLEEAKKRIDPKMMKASLKTKRKVEKTNGGYVCPPNTPKNHRLENAPLSAGVTENAKNVVDERATDLFINFKGTDNAETRNNGTLAERVSPELGNGIEEPYGIVDSMEEGISDKDNKQTVIKRLIEADTSLKSGTREPAESLTKICDSGTEVPNSVNDIPTGTGHNPKDDNVDNVNCHNVTKRNDGEEADASIIIIRDERNGTDESERGSNSGPVDEGVRIPGQLREADHHEAKCTDSGATEQARSNGESVTSKNILGNNKTSVHVESMTVRKGRRRSRVSDPEDSATRDLSRTRNKLSEEPNDHSESLDVVKAENFCIPENLEIENYVGANDDAGVNALNDANVRESILKSYSMDKRDNSRKFKLTRCPDESMGDNEQEESYTSLKEPVEKVSRTDCKCEPDKGLGKRCDDENSAEIVDRSTIQSGARESFPSSFDDVPGPAEEKNVNDLQRSLESERTAGKLLDSKCIIQEGVLQDNIDGLSLLASVSQHVSHLKAESKVKCDQIKVKDYASLRSMNYTEVTDDETDTSDSSNAMSQLLENPSTEIINRIVGVYPDDALDKVALHVEVTSSNEVNASNPEGRSLSNATDLNIHYDPDTSYNFTATENNVQTVKENTNVILNGETVVLLQKSPNSNLYIINKAVENSKDHGGEDDLSRLKEKTWLSPLEECGQYEVIASSDHGSFNIELSQCNGELAHQENKFIIGRNKGIKIEPEENSYPKLVDVKTYAKKVTLPNDTLAAAQQIYPDTMNMSASKPMDKRKAPKPNLTFRQNIKQEYNGLSSHIASNCTIQGYNGIHSHPREVEAQHPLHIPVSHPTTLPSIYGNCTANGDLCVPYHKHCTSVSCSLQINATASLHSHNAKPSNSCGRSHCTCIKCTYDIVAHCRQCIHPTTDAHVSCVDGNPYFLPTHSSVQTSAVQEHERTKSDTVVGKLYDDELLCKIEKSLMQNHPLETLEAQCESEKLFQKSMNQKLPLKKRLKAQAMMSVAYKEIPIKSENLGNYPGVPMMSIAALEALDGQQKPRSPIIATSFELSPAKKEDTHGNHYCNASFVRRDYYKDIHVGNSHHGLVKESTRKHERQFRSENDQTSDTACQESCPQRMFKTAAQRKEIIASAATVKSFKTDLATEEEEAVPYKKAKKTQSPLRQTRSSKRNVPKVNYCYTDVDPEWNPSGESRRKRKKASR